MLIFGSCVGDGERFARVAGPTIERHMSEGDVLLTDDGSRGICAAYNDFIERARSEPLCRGLVLLHDDVEILDKNFREKVLHALSHENIGIVGVIGGASLKTPFWWSGREQKGRVLETRGAINSGAPGPVDVVDGLMMALSRTTFERLEFDSSHLPGFHGYDTDICLKARSIGLDVVVAPITLLHRTRGGFGDVTAWEDALDVLESRWRSMIRPESPVEKLETIGKLGSAKLGGLRRRMCVVVGRSTGAVSRAIGRFLASSSGTVGPTRSRSNDDPSLQVVPACPVCEGNLVTPTVAHEEIIECEKCGLGVTWPRPALYIASDELRRKLHRGSRRAMRRRWVDEAIKRLHWLQLHRPDGVLLDVGCATGEFVEVASRAGYVAFGVESRRSVVSIARRNPASIVEGLVEDWREQHPGVLVDVVSMWHVLEDLPDPRMTLVEARRVLVSNGLLIGELPNFSCRLARVETANWEDASLATHWYHFTPESLRRLLEACGFSVELILPSTKRIYCSDADWQDRKNSLAMKGVDPNDEDIIRFVARKRASA